MTNKSIVSIVEDDRPVRESIAFLLRQHGFAVKSFASAQAFLEDDTAGSSGCLVLDVRLAGMSGLDLQASLAERDMDVPIVMMSASAPAPDVVRSMQGGAVDFLEKPLDPRKLVACVKSALELNAIRRHTARDRAVLVQRTRKLTPRETEVMHYVAAGLSNKKIAKQLNRSDKTIEIHRAQVMRKMEAQSLPDLVRMVEAFKRGSDPAPKPKSESNAATSER